MACGPRQGAARRSVAGLLESVSPTGKEDDPDRWGPPVGGREEGAPDLGRERKEGQREGEFGPREKKKKKGRGRWAGPAGLKTRGGKRKDFAFLKLKSNNSIQTQIQRIQI